MRGSLLMSLKVPTNQQGMQAVIKVQQNQVQMDLKIPFNPIQAVRFEYLKMKVESLTTRKLFLVLLLACQMLQQQVVPPQTVQQASVGKWLSSEDSKEKKFPRYLICGAEMNYFKRIMSTSCQITTKPYTQPVKFSCVVGKTIWERCNGIKFKYCNFQDWEDQKVDIMYGSWEYTGMRMCPKNSYVIDYMTKINENDGLTALFLTCRNKFTDEVTNVAVKDGVGTLLGPEFKVPVAKQYAYDYMLKVQTQADGGPFITGLNLAFTPFPEITNISITYDSLPQFDIRLEYYLMNPIRFDNLSPNKTDRIETIDPNKYMNQLRDNRAKRLNQNERLFAYSFANYKGKYHNTLLRRFLKDTFKDVSLFDPILATKLEQYDINDVDRKVIFRSKAIAPDFQFGKSFLRPFPVYNIMNYTIPYCFRLELRVNIYTVSINNPYTLSVTYSSGAMSYVEQIRGVYQGTIFGRPEIEDDNIWIC